MIVTTRPNRKYNEDLYSEPVETRLFLAKDIYTTAEALDVLSRDPFWYVRDLAAGNENCTLETLKRLHEDPDFRIQRSVERNPVWKAYIQEKKEPTLDEKIQKSEKMVTKKTNKENKEKEPIRV